MICRTLHDIKADQVALLALKEEGVDRCADTSQDRDQNVSIGSLEEPRWERLEQTASMVEGVKVMSNQEKAQRFRCIIADAAYPFGLQEEAPAYYGLNFDHDMLKSILPLVRDTCTSSLDEVA